MEVTAGELPRASHRLLRVHQTPAIDGVHAGLAQVGGRGEDRLLDIACAHPWERLVNKSGGAGDDRCGEGRTLATAALKGGTGDAREGCRTGRNDTPLGRQSTGIGVVGKAVRV